LAHDQPLTIIPLKPRAPPPLSYAFLQISSKAALVNRISTFEYSKSALYCDNRDPLTPVKIRRKSGIVKGARVVIEGSRAMNSGINLNELRRQGVDLKRTQLTRT
jgi:hypothetical protein